MFKFQSGYFVNIRNKKVISVKDKKDDEAQPVHVENRFGGRHGHSSQRWNVVYTDAMGDQAYDKKGELNAEFGFRVDETFFLRSQLPMQRVAECVGASNVALKKWYKNRRAQEWRFDPVSKTVRNRNWTSYVFSMEGTNLRCRSMNSRWF
jgi:hypothetical protein